MIPAPIKIIIKIMMTKYKNIFPIVFNAFNVLSTPILKIIKFSINYFLARFEGLISKQFICTINKRDEKKFLVNYYYFLNSCRNKNCYLLQCYHDCFEYIYRGMVLMADEHNKNNQDEQVVLMNNVGKYYNKINLYNLDK